MQMTESPENDNDFELRVKRVMKDRQRLRVVEIRYTPTPYADERLSRALGILLRSGARTATTSEESINAKKEEEPPKDSRPEKIAGQSDGEKG
jgi:hypothetical protein